MGLWFPKRLPGDARPGRPLPPHPSDKPRKAPKPAPPPADPKPEQAHSLAFVLVREAVWILGALCALMVLPWP